MNKTWIFEPNDVLLDEDKEDPPLYNLNGDYTYLLSGYYESVLHEINNGNIRPSSMECLDAYITGISLEKARLNDINVLNYEIATDKTIPKRFPLICSSMNPFSDNYTIVSDINSYEQKLKSITLSGKYFAVLQYIDDTEYRLDIIRSIFGNNTIAEYNAFAHSIFNVFKIPLMKIMVVVTLDKYYFCGIDPMPYDTLTINERKIIEGMGKWQR